MLVCDAFGVFRQTTDFKFEIPDSRFQRWRRGWDSNPRNGSPFTAFPVLPIQPLLHLSPERISDCGLRIANLRRRSLEPKRKLTSKTNPQSEFRNPKSLHPFMPRRETISLYWCTNLSGDPSTIQPEEVPTQLLSIPVKGFLSRTRRINSFAAFKKSSQLDT